MSTIKWSKEHQHLTLAQIERSADALGEILKTAKDRNKDGDISESELKKALVGRSRDEWSLVMGHYASTLGFVHGPVTKSDLKLYAGRFLCDVAAADANDDGVLSLTELRTLKNRGQERLVEFAKKTAASPAVDPTVDPAVEQALRDAVQHQDSLDAEVPENVLQVSTSEVPPSIRATLKAAINKAEAELGGDRQDSALYQVMNEDGDEIVGYVIHSIASGEPDWEGSQLVAFDATGRQVFSEYEDIS